MSILELETTWFVSEEHW